MTLQGPCSRELRVEILCGTGWDAMRDDGVVEKKLTRWKSAIMKIHIQISPYRESSTC